MLTPITFPTLPTFHYTKHRGLLINLDSKDQTLYNSTCCTGSQPTLDLPDQSLRLVIVQEIARSRGAIEQRQRRPPTRPSSQEGLTDKPSRPSTCIDDSAGKIRRVCVHTTCCCSSFSALARTPIICSRGVRLQDPSWMGYWMFVVSGRVWGSS
jgi:hypothetical protein